MYRLILMAACTVTSPFSQTRQNLSSSTPECSRACTASRGPRLCRCVGRESSVWAGPMHCVDVPGHRRELSMLVVGWSFLG